MPSKSQRRTLIVGALITATAALWLSAGPLNPPTGPVSAGGKTTQEIFDAVTANSQATGAVGGRGPAVPGNSYEAGTLSLSTNPVISGACLGVRLSVTQPQTGGAVAVLNTCTVIREIGANSTGAWRNVTLGGTIPSAIAVLPSSGGNTIYQFNNPRIAAMRAYNIQRADGTFANIEELDLVPQSIRFTDANNNIYQYNFVTGVGGN